MSYRELQRQKAIQIRDMLFRDPGNGIFFGKQRDFVLKQPSLNLWDGIREDAKRYFKENGIQWWKGDTEDPTGHLLSSQVACLNHLYYIRQRRDIAKALLQTLNPDIEDALPVDDGFVAFEYIGNKQYLKEKAFKRGANCTSIDAVMLGITSDSRKIIFLIEWKYTEKYEREDLYIKERANVYDPIILDPNGPFVSGSQPKVFYYEPFYQMMRQTILGWCFEKNYELGCSGCINVHVIPNANHELKSNITSPAFMSSKDIHQAWKKVLKAPDSYISIDPESFLIKAKGVVDTDSWTSYLNTRYWK